MTRSDERQADSVVDSPLCVVGLGASAGGLEALQTFFANMPDDTGLAFVVVQHLSPDYKSLMVELLSKTTAMAVKRIEDGMPLEPNCVYLIPPKKNVSIYHRKLLLADQDPGRGLNLPIDLFFRSLAEDVGERAVGIVLSGTGSDGTRGIRAIKELGGLVMAQDPTTAKFDGMPASVIATGLADYVLPPELMSSELLKFVSHPFLSKSRSDDESLGAQEDVLTRITALLRRETGVDFALYKPATVVRRIERRMGIAQLQTMKEYLSYLQQSPEEANHLYRDLLIGVTKFFRDTEAFDVLTSKHVPDVFERNRDARQVRVWCAGCATGEEAYSLAILMREEMHRRSDRTYDVKVFATDIDRSAIEVASAGTYPASIAAEIPERLLKRYFVDRGGSYQVSREIREMVVFAAHNILKDPPFTKINLISCRNMLIYLQPVLQQRVLSLFSFSLQEGGILFLGGSETTGEMANMFEPLDSKWKIFRRRPGLPARIEGSMSLDMPRERLLRSHFLPVGTQGGSLRTDDLNIMSIQEKLLTRYGPTSLLVDEAGDLLHAFGEIPDYMKLSSGRVSLHIMKMLPKELSLAVSTALHRAIKSREAVEYTNIRVQVGDTVKMIDLRVEPLSADSSQQLRLLLLLTEQRSRAESPGVSETYDMEADQNQRITDLEHELQMTRENLQATVEELETSNEELQATNEELLASNEELQSTNEELQSVNEELYTVNAEYQNKIGELTELNQDMENLLASSQVGTIFLDQDLRIRKFTAAVGEEVNLLSHDTGRPIQDMGHPFLRAIADEVPKALKGERIDRVEDTPDGRSMLLRLRPYHAEMRGIEGVVITLINVTDLRRAEAALEESVEFAQAMIDALDESICVLDGQGKIVTINKAWREFASSQGVSVRCADIGDDYLDVCDRAKGEGEEDARQLAQGIREIIAGQEDIFELEYPCHAPNEQRWFRVRVSQCGKADPLRVLVIHQRIR